MSDDHQIDNCLQCGAAVKVFPGGLDYDLHFCSAWCGWGGPVRTMPEVQAEALYNILRNHTCNTRIMTYYMISITREAAAMIAEKNE